MLGYLLGRAGDRRRGAGKARRLLPRLSRRHRASLHAASDGRTRSDRRLPEAAASAPAEDGGHVRRRETVRIADLGRLNVKYPFIAFMPQWDFLNFLRESGRRFASLKVMMSTEAVDLLRDGERVTGVKAKTPDGAHRYRGRPDRRLRRPALAGARARRPRGRGNRRADGCAVVSCRQARRRKREPVCAGRSRQDDGDLRSRRLLAVRPTSFPRDAVRRGEGEGTAALLDDIARMAPILKSGLSEVKAGTTSSC